jgi:predicted ATP-dependent serine protease
MGLEVRDYSSKTVISNSRRSSKGCNFDILKVLLSILERLVEQATVTIA